MATKLNTVQRLMRETNEDGYISGRSLVGLVRNRPTLTRGVVPIGRALWAIGATQAQANRVARLQGWCDAPLVSDDPTPEFAD